MNGPKQNRPASLPPKAKIAGAPRTVDHGVPDPWKCILFPWPDGSAGRPTGADGWNSGGACYFIKESGAWPAERFGPDGGDSSSAVGSRSSFTISLWKNSATVQSSMILKRRFHPGMRNR